LTPEKVLEDIDDLVARCFPDTRLETQANLLHTRKWFSFNMLGFLKDLLINWFDKKRLNNPKLGNYEQLQASTDGTVTTASNLSYLPRF